MKTRNRWVVAVLLLAGAAGSASAADNVARHLPVETIPLAELTAVVQTLDDRTSQIIGESGS